MEACAMNVIYFKIVVLTLVNYQIVAEVLLLIAQEFTEQILDRVVEVHVLRDRCFAAANLLHKNPQIFSLQDFEHNFDRVPLK